MRGGGRGGERRERERENNNSTKRWSERKKSIFRSDDVSEGGRGRVAPYSKGREKGYGRYGKEGGSRVNVHQVYTTHTLTLSIFLIFFFSFFPFFSVRRFAFIIGNHNGNYGGTEREPV